MVQRRATMQRQRRRPPPLLLLLLVAALAACLATHAAAAAAPTQLAEPLRAASNASDQQQQQQQQQQQPAVAAARAAPIGASVTVLFLSDVDGGAASPCAAMARRALETGARAVNFVVTGYYVADGAGRAYDIGYREAEGDEGLAPPTPESARRLTDGLAACMRAAAAAGAAELAAHVHLDDAGAAGGGGGAATWRNAVDFDPLARYSGLSYWDALVRPAAAAALDAATFGGGGARPPVVRLALQAEMGATLFYHARSYRSLVTRARALLAPAGGRVGVNLNWEKACGCPPALMESTNYYSDLRARWRESGVATGRISLPDVQALFRAVDWIGVSAYAPLPVDPSPRDLDAPFASLERELALFGVPPLRALGKELVFSEFGIGGGSGPDGAAAARSPAVAAAAPYWGVAGRYSSARDPWADAAMAAFRRRVYAALVAYARAGGGPRYPVAAVYLWSLGSHDATGVSYMSHPTGGGGGGSGSGSGDHSGSSSGSGYGDPAIAAMLKRYNDATAPAVVLSSAAAVAAAAAAPVSQTQPEATATVVAAAAAPAVAVASGGGNATAPAEPTAAAPPLPKVVAEARAARGGGSSSGGGTD